MHLAVNLVQYHKNSKFDVKRQSPIRISRPHGLSQLLFFG